MSSNHSQRAAQFTPSENHYRRVPGYKERCRLKDFQRLLMEQPNTFANGLLCEWKGKRVGPGIYEIWLEEKK